GSIKPIIDCAFPFPTFAHCIRLEAGAAPQCAQFLNRPDHPTAITFHHVVAESVETDFFQKPASVVDELGVNEGSAMTEIRHVTESRSVPSLVLARRKTFPVARKLAACRREFVPPQLSVGWI